MVFNYQAYKVTIKNLRLHYSNLNSSSILNILVLIDHD
jgi:hypothetical protein